MLEELMTWYASLLQWLVEYKKDPKTIMAQKLSAPNEMPWHAERRRKKTEMHEQLRLGKHLAELRDSGRKRFHDMSATEQRVLEDAEYGRLKKQHDEVRVRKPWFRISDL